MINLNNIIVSGNNSGEFYDPGSYRNKQDGPPGPGGYDNYGSGPQGAGGSRRGGGGYRGGAFSTPPPNFSRSNGGYGGGHQGHTLQPKEGDKVLAKYWEVSF